MKKSLLALGAACIALSGMAATPQLPKGPVHVANERCTDLKGPGSLRYFNRPSMKKAPAKVGTPEDVITSVEGELQNVSISGSGYMVFFGSLYYYENEISSSHVVYGDNNEVYIYNILPIGQTDSYVKGVKDGDKVVVDLPQTLVWNAENDFGWNLAIYDMLDTEEGSWYFLSDDSSITFSVAEDGTLTSEGLSEEKILALGYSYDDSWSGYGVWDLTIAPFNDEVVTVPSDFEVSKNFWLIPQDGYAQFVNFAQGGDEVYLQGVSSLMPEAWIKASVEYGEDYTATLSIAQNQYLGVYSSYYMYTKCAKLVEDEYGNEDYELLPDDYMYELVWDFEEETMVAKDPEVVLLINVSNKRADPLESLSNITFEHQYSFDGTPENPTGLEFADYLAEEGYLQFFFNVPAVSTEGDYLLTDDLYYVVYVDGEEWTLDADEYEIPETLEEIPWSLNEYWICWGWDSNIAREVDFFVEGITTLGVQSVYRYNGEETRSEIVTIDLEEGNDPSAVAAINAGKKITDVKYYDLSGRQVAEPAAGIFVKRVTFEDGTVATFKKAAR